MFRPLFVLLPNFTFSICVMSLYFFARKKSFTSSQFSPIFLPFLIFSTLYLECPSFSCIILPASITHLIFFQQITKNTSMSKMVDWKIGTLGCFSNMKVCIITYFLPCVTIGKIAENTGTDTMMCGALKSIIPFYSCCYMKELRDKVAKNSGIMEENCCNFLMKMWCCGICLIVQTGHECGAFEMGQDMTRE